MVTSCSLSSLRITAEESTLKARNGEKAALPIFRAKEVDKAWGRDEVLLGETLFIKLLERISNSSVSGCKELLMRESPFQSTPSKNL